VLREVRLWSHLRHKHLLPLLGTCTSGAADGSQKLYIVSMLMSNGNAMDYLRQQPMADRLLLLRQVASALVYLHTPSGLEKGVVVHGDIKGENVLIDHTGSARLGDFGLTRIHHEVADEIKNYSITPTSIRNAGTLRFKAPELLVDDEDDESLATVTPQTDVWAFGMLVYQFYSGMVPFHRLNDFQYYVKVKKGEQPEKPDTCHVDLWAIAKTCWILKALFKPRPAMPLIESRLRALHDALSCVASSTDAGWAILTLLRKYVSEVPCDVEAVWPLVDIAKRWLDEQAWVYADLFDEALNRCLVVALDPDGIVGLQQAIDELLATYATVNL